MRQVKLTVASATLALSMLAMSVAFSATIENLPAEKTQGNIVYVTGGVGNDEATAMKLAKSMYPLSLEFIQHATPRDEFLASVDVSITNHAGEAVLQVVSEGPYLLAKLPPGKYTVNAKLKDIAKTSKVTLIENKPQHLIFEWK